MSPKVPGKIWERQLKGNLVWLGFVGVVGEGVSLPPAPQLKKPLASPAGKRDDRGQFIKIARKKQGGEVGIVKEPSKNIQNPWRPSC